MHYESSLYRLTVSNSSSLTQINLLMNDESVAGAIWMAHTLFEDKLNMSTPPFRLELIKKGSATTYLDHGVLLQQTNNVATVYMKNFPQYVIGFIPFVIDPLPQNTWSEYLSEVELAIGHILNPVLMTYSCRMFNNNLNKSMILQFMTTSFLEGARQACSLCNVNISDYLDNIHLADIEIKVDYIK